MRIVFALALSAMLIGCGGTSGGGSNDLAEASGDMATAGGDLGLLPFGAACTDKSQCATGSCFIGGMMSFCTMPCTAATQATDCPVPPTSGTCNMKGFCKP